MKMTTTTTASGADRARREEILRRTLIGIEEDFEDLREELSTALVDYEGRLNKVCNALPEWLVLEPQRLREHFLFPEDSPFARSVLGPRHAALVAARVEAFVDTWLGDRVEPRKHPEDDEETRVLLEANTAEVEAFLVDAVEMTRALAIRARRDLDLLLDQIVVDLEHQRETDVDALEILVHEGEIETGRDSQEEIANIWEEQRKRVEGVHRMWETLEDLLDEGSRHSLQVVVELRALFARALEGLGGAYDELAMDEPSRLSIEQAVEDVATGQGIDEVIGDTMPGEQMTLELANSMSEVDDDPVDEDDLDEQDLPEPLLVSDEPVAEPPLVEDQLSLKSSCFRIRTAWIPISATELSAVLLPPGLLLLAMVATGLGSLLGMAPNPMRAWSWALPTIGVSMAWLIVLPLVLNWRPSWKGLRPGFVRFGEIVDEVQLRVDEGRLSMDKTSWALADVRKIHLSRWESPLDETRGWIMTIEPPYHQPLVVATGEFDQALWQASSLPIVTAPDDAWQASPEDFTPLKGLVR